MPELISTATGGHYPIWISNHALTTQTGRLAAGCCKGRRAVIVTDEQVAALYLGAASTSLTDAGFTVDAVQVVPGEGSKTMNTVLSLYQSFHQAGLTRDDLVVALGGGVVGDLAGFAAATYLRGVPLMQIPTTLLAQVDSSIGGKNGVDLPYGKNLAGTFYQPRAVLIDPLVLKTLSRRRMAEGLAEVIKSGLIRDAELFRQIEQKTYDLEWVIDRCVRIKAGIVERDEHDHGERMLLNFGHTIGHAVEHVTGYSAMTHGEAVSVGIMAALAIGEHLNLTPKGTGERVGRVLAGVGLPLDASGLSADDILAAVRSDKKKRSNRLHFILLRSIGEGFVQSLSLPELDTAFHAVWPHG